MSLKNNIYIYPILEAFKENTECPFCLMRKQLDDESVEYMMGPSYMEDDIRMETNKLGFCATHYGRLYQNQNRLGLALMLHTHVQTINEKLPGLVKGALDKSGASKGLFGKKKSEDNALADFLTRTAESCYICNRVDNTFSRYVDTFFYMLKKDNEAKDMVKNSKGFCLEHLALLLTEGEKKLNAKEYEGFLQLVLPIQTDKMKALEEDLDWFIKKFDYLYRNEPWKNAQDAVPRGLEKIGGVKVE